MMPIFLKIGPITIHTYGVLIAVGFLLALSMMRREFDRVGLPIHWVDSLALMLMISGLLGARIFYFLFNEFETLRSDPLSFFRVWEGGLVFYGGFLGAFLAALYFAKKHDVSFLNLTDALAAPLLLGQAIGRWGCFAAGCCFGRETNVGWGVTFTHPESLALKFVKLHPAQIYESLGNLSLFLLVLYLGRKSPTKGFLTCFYLIGYGLLRFNIEFLRGDDRGAILGGLQPSQWLALLMIFIAVSIFTYVKKTEHS